MYDVITIGSATVDVFAVIPQKFKQIKLGDKVLIEGIAFETGGGGINSAVALSRMGLRTAFLGKLGHDYNAFKILHELKKEKVKFIKTSPSEYPTSYSFILNSRQEKDRVLFAYKGASDYLSYNEFSKSELNTKWIYKQNPQTQSIKVIPSSVFSNTKLNTCSKKTIIERTIKKLNKKPITFFIFSIIFYSPSSNLSNNLFHHI